MANKKLTTYYGIPVEMREKQDLIDVIDGMLEDSAGVYKKAKTNLKKRQEMTHLSFFGSVLHHLKDERPITINIEKLVGKIDMKTFSHVDAKEEITNILIQAVKDAGASQE